MRYTALIHHLLVASEQAKRTNTDVADRLREHCVDGINIIRETLMNSVCDPRFKMHVDVIPGWRKLAQRHLENFAEHLQSIIGLDESLAYYEMDEMLDRWLTHAMTIAEDHDSEHVSITRLPKEKENKNYQNIQNNLERYIYDSDEELYHEKEEDELDDMLSGLSSDEGDESMLASDGDEGVEDKTSGNLGDESDSESIADKKEDGPGRDFSSIDGDSSEGMGSGRGLGHKVELQNRFLSNVPHSLIQLAKIIGRSGNNVFESSGSFVTSSKSDIAGITTGDDLSNMLPSELAMLSEPATRDIFYRNFVTKRLQVFASASQDKIGKKKQDGPIIICLDTSSSMQGDPILIAKSLTIAICIIAQRRKRKVLVIKYSYSHDLFRLHNIERDKKSLLDFLGVAEMGGNDEDRMFRWLFDDVMPFEGDYSTADILCISDFGWTPISKEVMEKIHTEKQKGMTFYGLNIGESPMAEFMKEHMFQYDEMFVGPEDVCDSLWEYSDGVCKETKKKGG